MALAVLMLISFLAIRSCKRQVQDTTDLADAVEVRQAPPVHYQDASGRDHAVKQEVQASRDVVQIAYRNELDSIKAILKVKDKQIEGLIIAGTRTEATVPLQSMPVPGDTCSYDFSYSDRFFSADGRAGHNSYLHYIVTDSLVFVPYWKRSWALGRKTHYVDAFSYNPNVRITGLDAARVIAREPGRIGLGPFVGYGYDGQRWRPTAGISFHYSIIRF